MVLQLTTLYAHGSVHEFLPHQAVLPLNLAKFSVRTLKRGGLKLQHLRSTRLKLVDSSLASTPGMNRSGRSYSVPP